MKRLVRGTWWWLLAIALGGVPIACGSDSAGGSSVGGGGGAAPDAAGGQAGSAETGGAGGSGGAVQGIPLGRRCETDADCGTELTCIPATSSAMDNEGPAGGYCTIPCDEDPNVCMLYDPHGTCRQLASGASFCVEGCNFGPDTSTQFDAEKCHGRPEVACSPLYGAQEQFLQGACVPTCNADADCGGGMHCNPRTGLCSAVAISGKLVGDPCTPDASGGGCRGYCTPIAGKDGTLATYTCVDVCTWGAKGACAGPAGSGQHAACAGTNTTVKQHGGTGFGDLAACIATCSCNAECANPAFVCHKALDPAWPLLYGKPGRCSLPFDASDPGISDCSQDAGTD